MIVRRSIHRLKHGKEKEAVALVQEALGAMTVTFRVYTSRIGAPFGTLAVEMEFESMADLEKADAEFNASPEGTAFYEKWHQVTEPDTGHAEIWRLEE